jgi:hypothetical protein
VAGAVEAALKESPADRGSLNMSALAETDKFRERPIDGAA